jgi:uncharacterized protein YyaL (SSP411 family)
MEREAYADPEVARLVEAGYVAVRVDADRRPDINDRYSPGAVPATAFLDPDGVLLYATTYLDADELKRLLVEFSTRYEANRGQVAEAVRGRDAKIAQILRARYAGPGIAIEEMVPRTLEGILADFDPIHGGFGRGAKLPLPASLLFLAETLHAGGDPRAKPVLEKSLDAIWRGLWDPIDGGFFAGCAGDGWTRPSTEKLLDVNAGLMPALLKAGRHDRALATAQWIVNTLYDSDRRAFMGSQAADEEYYSRDAAERAKMAKPEIDRTVYTDRSALASSAFLATGDPTLADAPTRALGHVLGRQRDAHYEGGGIGLLRDRVALGHALLDIGTVLEAERLGADLFAEHGSAEERGLLDRRPGVEELGELSRKRSDPGETGSGARFLLRLAKAVGEPRYRADAARILRGVPDFGPDWGHATAEIARAARLLLEGGGEA